MSAEELFLSLFVLAKCFSFKRAEVRICLRGEHVASLSFCQLSVPSSTPTRLCVQSFLVIFDSQSFTVNRHRISVLVRIVLTLRSEVTVGLTCDNHPYRHIGKRSAWERGTVGMTFSVADIQSRRRGLVGVFLRSLS